MTPNDQADVADSEQVERMLERIGSLDVLVNNAADQRNQALLHAERETQERTLAVNVTGPMLTMQASTPHMGADGSIVNVASMHSFVPLTGAAVYATSKGAGSGSLAPNLSHPKLDSSPGGLRPERRAARLRRCDPRLLPP
jgi:NAD(P)-dependent dehydrogenase (short-subunit alcohol dehydrogenase family)